MYRFKIYGKFIVWLLKQVMKGPLTIVAYMHIFVHEWKNNCREEFGLALLMYLLTIMGSMLGGAISLLFSHDDATIKQMLPNTLATSFYFATGLFIFVILLASYDKFIEEYERSFTELKK